MAAETLELERDKMDRMREPIERGEVSYADVVSRYSGELGYRLATQGGSPERVEEVIQTANGLGLIIGRGREGDLAARPSPKRDGSMEVVRMDANTFDEPEAVTTVSPPADSYAAK